MKKTNFFVLIFLLFVFYILISFVFYGGENLKGFNFASGWERVISERTLFNKLATNTYYPAGSPVSGNCKLETMLKNHVFISCQSNKLNFDSNYPQVSLLITYDVPDKLLSLTYRDEAWYNNESQLLRQSYMISPEYNERLQYALFSQYPYAMISIGKLEIKIPNTNLDRHLGFYLDIKDERSKNRVMNALLNGEYMKNYNLNFREPINITGFRNVYNFVQNKWASQVGVNFGE